MARGQTPPEPPLRLDPYGDPLPEGAVLRLGTDRYRGGASTFVVLYSSDGKLLASAGWDMAIRLWDVNTTRERQRWFLGWGPGRKPTPRGQEVCPAIAFSPDGKTLAGSGAGQDVHIWDTDTGKELRCIQGKAGLIAGLAFAPDGKTLAGACADGGVRLWDPATGRERRSLRGHAGPALAVAFSPDGRTLASGGSDKTVRLWDAETGKGLHRCTGHEGEVRTVCFVLKGKQVASMEKQSSVRVWEVDSGKEAKRFGTYGVGYALFRGADEASLVTVAAACIETWDVRTAKDPATIYLVPQTGYFCGSLSPDGKTLAVGGHDATVTLLAYPSGQKQGVLRGADPEVHSVVFSPDGKTLAAGTDHNTIQMWDLAAGRQTRRLEGHEGDVHRLAYSPDGERMASTAGDNTVRLWDVGTGKERHCLRGHQARVESLAFSPDGKTLASAGEEPTVRLWDVETGKERASYKGRQDSVWGVVFSPDGKSLAALGDRVCVWNLDTGKEREFARQERLAALWYSPEGRLLALSHDYNEKEMLTLWDVAEQRQVGEIQLPPHGNAKLTIAVSPDGRTLATGRHYNDRDPRMRIHLWEVATGKLRREFRGHEGYFIEELAFSPDNRRLASGCGDSTVLVWDVYGTPGRRPAGEPDAEQLRRLWDDLRGSDGGSSFRSMQQLLASPRQVLPLLKGELRPVPKLEAERVARLLADLDANDFGTRERATGELRRLGDAVEVALRRTLERGPSAEVSRRVGKLLEEIEADRGPNVPAERLRRLRALEVLEQLGTPEARAWLAELAAGEPEAPLTRQVQAALRRLERGR
jgi:WD40 repeat protein